MSKRAPAVGDLVSWKEYIGVVQATRGVVLKICWLSEITTPPWVIDNPVSMWMARSDVKILSKAQKTLDKDIVL